MANFVIIPGGGGAGSSWNLVSSELSRLGHDATPVDLPCDDPSAGWPEYVETIVRAAGDRTDIVIVAHSAGGFVAPLIFDRLPVKCIVLVAGMIPAPGETFMEWWSNTRFGETGVDFSDETAIFYHDVPTDLAKADAKASEGRDNFPSEPWPLDTWPDVPTKFLLCRDDGMFPQEFMRRVVSERLGIEPDEIDGGHMVMLSRPDELAARLVDLSEES